MFEKKTAPLLNKISIVFLLTLPYCSSLAREPLLHGELLPAEQLQYAPLRLLHHVQGFSHHQEGTGNHKEPGRRHEMHTLQVKHWQSSSIVLQFGLLQGFH